MNITKLTTDGRREPLGLDNKAPAFSWQLTGEGYQQDYRILVASSRSLLEADAADLWDSGTVVSGESVRVPYEGRALESCTRYFWKVISGGIESEITWFETAFLDPEREFKAEWIGLPLGFSGAADDVRFDFEIEKPVKSARFYVAALGTGQFYLNGALLDDGYFDGAVAVWRKNIYYRTFELHFRQGKNALCARLGYGFYGAKRMYGVMRTVFEDGTVSVTPTFAGRAWNVKRDPVLINGVYDGEVYDARREENWLDPDYKVTFGNWVAAFAADAPAGAFKANPLPPMRVVREFAPASMTPDGGGYRVDTGVNLCGFLKIAVRGARGARVEIAHAERLLPDGRLDNANYRAADCRDVYYLKGEGEEIYAPTFTYHGFQYADIRTEGEVSLLNVSVCYLRSDVAPAGTFACSSETLNDLHRIAVQTEGNNLNGTFTDCPQRDERLGWLNDISSRIYQSVCNFALDGYLANFIDMITAEQSEEGVIPDTVPFEVGSTKADVISAYTVLGLIHWRFYKDKEVLRRNYAGFRKWVAYLKADADRNGGTVGHAIYGDWCPALIYAVSRERDTFSAFVEPRFMSAAYYLWYLLQMGEIARILGYAEDAAQYARDYAHDKAKFDEVYFHPETGMYGSGSQTECAVALTVFREDEALRRRWAQAANDDIVARGYHMTCGNQGYRHLFYNLAAYGYAETLVSLLENPAYPGWGYMLKQGATSVWERWEDSVGSDMHSFNHPMFTAYDGFFCNYIAGIRTEECEGAFQRIVVAPCFVRQLSFAEGTLDTVRGKIFVRWERAGEDILLSVKTPGNTSLTVRAAGMTLRSGGIAAQDALSLSNGAFTITIQTRKRHEDI